MAKSSTEQLAPGVFVLPGMPEPPELLPELLAPSDPLPLPSAPKHLIRWGIAGAVALVTLTGTVSRLPPPTVPIVMVTPLPPAPSPALSSAPPPPAPQDMMAQWWATQKPHLPVIRHRLATFHWHRLGHSKTERPDPETLRLNQQQLPDKPDEVGP